MTDQLQLFMISTEGNIKNFKGKWIFWNRNEFLIAFSCFKICRVIIFKIFKIPLSEFDFFSAKSDLKQKVLVKISELAWHLFESIWFAKTKQRPTNNVLTFLVMIWPECLGASMVLGSGFSAVWHSRTPAFQSVSRL